MKRIILLISTIILIVILIFSYKYVQYKNTQNDVKKFNKIFLDFNKDNLYGTDITTVMNKAIDNNEKYEIEKNEKNRYIDDGNYSIKIEVKMKLNETIYDMEQIYNLGTEKFIEHYGDVTFNCTKVEYHKTTGRISKLVFESEE